MVPDAAAHNFQLPNAAGIEVPVTQNVDPNVRQAILNTLALYPLPTVPILTAAGLPTGTGYSFTRAFANGNEDYLIGRVDYTLSDNSALFVRYVLDYADFDHTGGDAGLLPWWPEKEQMTSPIFCTSSIESISRK